MSLGPQFSQPEAGAAEPSGFPGIFTAIRQQLGLTLTPGKDSVEIFAVDPVQRPTAN